MTTNQSTLCPWWSEPVCTVVRCCWGRVRVPLYWINASREFATIVAQVMGFTTTRKRNLHIFTPKLYIFATYHFVVKHWYCPNILQFCWMTQRMTIMYWKYEIFSSNYQIRIRTFVSVLKLTSSNRSLRFASARSIDRSDISPLHFNVDSEAYSTHPQHDSILIPSAFKMCNE